MTLEELISNFSATAKLENAPATDGIWHFSADGNVFGVTQDDAGERVFLFGDILAPDPEKREALLKSAMEANYFHRGTGGATFALNPETGTLTLFESKPLEGLDEEKFYAFIERFVNALAVWNGIAVQAKGDSEAPAPEAAEPAVPEPFSIGSFMRV
ncbi:MAG: type III secretion system chaperone [Kiritimatiellae bacterium]|nr:type III secretion system chaperone [Kiritimatiellia bacterium]